MSDLDRDGRKDLFQCAPSSSQVRIYLASSEEEGTFQAIHVLDRKASFVRLGDIDGDGRLDMALPAEEGEPITLFFGDGTGYFPTVLQLQAQRVESAMALVDLDGDSRLEVVVGRQPLEFFDLAELLVFRNTGGRGFRARACCPVPFKVDILESCDVDGDGQSDVLCASGLAGTVTVLRGNGDGTLQRFERSFGMSSGFYQPFRLATGDFDGDGLVDVATKVMGFRREGFSILYNRSALASR